MELKITKEEQNPLFKRKKIIGTLVSESAPKRHEVIKTLSEKYSIPVDAIRILDIKGGFGTKEFTIRANIYTSADERNKYERLSKKEIESEKKLTEKPTETKEEAPAEEKLPKTPEEKTPAEKAIGINPVEEAKKVEEKKQEENKKEKDKSKEEKLNEKELQA